MTDSETRAVQSRNLPFENIDNIRDLGGLRTADGQVTRFGRLFRSSALHAVTQAEVDSLVHSAGLRLIMDLRSPQETEIQGRGLLSRHVPAYINLPISADKNVASGPLPALKRASDLASHYIEYLQASVAQFAMAVRILADPSHQPALFHCAAGKDRTGTLAAVVLDAIGVLHEEIIEDYALTRHGISRVLLRMDRPEKYRDVAYADLPPMIRSDPETMRSLLAHLRDDLGGAAHWLKANGVEPATIEQLKRGLLQAA